MCRSPFATSGLLPACQRLNRETAAARRERKLGALWGAAMWFDVKNALAAMFRRNRYRSPALSRLARSAMRLSSSTSSCSASSPAPSGHCSSPRRIPPRSFCWPSGPMASGSWYARSAVSCWEPTLIGRAARRRPCYRSLAKVADRMVVMAKGEIAFDGTPADIAAAPEILERHLGI